MHSIPRVFNRSLILNAIPAFVFATGLFSIAISAACNGGSGGCSDVLPIAGYAKSCESCEMQGGVLSCSCGDGHSHMQQTRLDTCSCETSDQISNCSGHLQCTECSCIPKGNACGPSGKAVAACCSGFCGAHGTCE